MTRIQSFFRRHPGIHNWVHRAMYLTAGILIAKDDLLAAVGYVPEGTIVPKLIGWILAGAAFSKILLGAADKKLDAAAPVVQIPASEAITAVDKENATPKEK